MNDGQSDAIKLVLFINVLSCTFPAMTAEIPLIISVIWLLYMRCSQEKSHLNTPALLCAMLFYAHMMQCNINT